MKTIFRAVVTVVFAMVIVAAGPSTVWADCSAVSGIWLGHENMDTSTAWTFTLINLTNSNVQIGAKGSTEGHDLGDNFPYGQVYKPGNASSSTTPALTTWQSDDHNKIFPDHCSSTVNFFIQDGSGLYNFSLLFAQDPSYWAQKAVTVNFNPPYGTSTWKYSRTVNNDNGYYAYKARDGHEGILFAISDKYILNINKPNKHGNGDNQLFLVITQRTANNSYTGKQLQWYME